MNVKDMHTYYNQFLNCTIIDYKISNGFPILILRREINEEEFLYEVTVSKNDQGTEPGTLLGFPISRMTI
tara:strand:- start:1878 stop:2087 length:210 start_codon:yes stop_codon:yes gene_type:complete